MLSIEEKLEQKGKEVLITPESEIEIIKFEDTKNEQHEETSSNESHGYVTNEKIESIKNAIRSEKREVKFSKACSAFIFSISAAGILLLAKGRFDKIITTGDLAITTFMTCGMCGMMAVTTLDAVTSSEIRIKHLEDELDEEYENEINKILLIKR